MAAASLGGRPRISIVLPAYNAEATILETVASVLAQTVSDWELLAIDDGSTDGTAERLAAVGDARVRVFSFPNRGEPAARNRGLARAGGELVAFIDADDRWTPDKLETQLQALDARPGAAVAYSWTRFVDAAGRDLYAQRPIFLEGDVYRHLLVSNFTCSGSNVLVRRAAITAVGGFDESLPVSSDWEFCVRLAARWPYAVVPRYQILYRQSRTSISAATEIWEAHGRRAIERVFASVPAALQPLKRRRLANFYLHVAHRALGAAPDDPQAWRRTGRGLLRALRLRPALLLDRTAARVVAKWLLLAVAPGRRARRRTTARPGPSR